MKISKQAFADGHGLCFAVTLEKDSEKTEIVIYSGGFEYSCKQAIIDYVLMKRLIPVPENFKGVKSHSKQAFGV